MRNFVAATVAATLIASSALAATDVGPLAAGKPAGVKQAQDFNEASMWWIVGLGLVAAGIAVVASGNSNSPLAAGTVTSTTTTTTAPATAKGGGTTTTTT